MDFDKPKVYGDTSITDGLVVIVTTMIVIPMSGDRVVQDDLDAGSAAQQWPHPHTLWRALPHLPKDFK